MKTTVLLVILALANGARAEIHRTKPKPAPSNAGKRGLQEGNVFGKRAPVLATASPSLSSGIEYADAKETAYEKSPSQAYESPMPQIAKISDVLTGQGPFQEAIAGHLYSPVSVYQQKSPTYEVAAPVPSQLAYSEHRVSIPNYTVPKQQTPKETPYNQQQLDQIHQLLQHIPNNHFIQPYKPIQYPQPVQYQPYIGPVLGAIYQEPDDQRYQQVNQRDLRGHSVPSQIVQKQSIQTFNTKPQNALSYATFIYNPVDAIGQHHHQIPQQQTQEPQYQHQNQPQQAQPPPQIQYQLQHPLQYEARLLPQHQEIKQQTFTIQPSQPHNQQIQIKNQLQPQQFDVSPHSKSFQRQVKETLQIIPVQNIGYIQAPTFPPIQYFLKFAPSTANYQHQ